MDTATFKGSISGSQSGRFVGLYPHNPISSYNSESSTVTTSLDCVQTAVENSFDPKSFLSVGVANQQQIFFRNVCGGIRFTVSNTGIKRITLRSLDPGVTLTGKVDIRVSDSDIPTASAIANKSDSVVLLCPDPEGFKTNTHYYMTTLPASLTMGFEFVFYSGNSKTSTVCHQPVEIKRSVYSTVNSADDQTSINKIKAPIDLSVGETANCYIISKAGYYKFLPTEGNFKDIPISGIESVRILWETDNTSNEISENDIIRNVRLGSADGYIYFETPETLKDGNALIAAYNGNTVKWSWHIWCCNGYDPDATAQKYKEFDRSAYLTARVMMDRNIGALSNSPESQLSNGLMYQWGRKDPFMGSADRTKAVKMYSTHPAATVNNWETPITQNYTIQYPNTFICSQQGGNYTGDLITSGNFKYWKTHSQSKPKHDPCPAGWRVPDGGTDSDYNPWTISKRAAITNLELFDMDKVNLGAYIDLTSNGGKAWYPCNGYLQAETSDLMMSGALTYYWSATPENSGYNVYTFRITINPEGDNYRAQSDQAGKIRAEGHSVRCIKDVK